MKLKLIALAMLLPMLLMTMIPSVQADIVQWQGNAVIQPYGYSVVAEFWTRNSTGFDTDSSYVSNVTRLDYYVQASHWNILLLNVTNFQKYSQNESYEAISSGSVIDIAEKGTAIQVFHEKGHYFLVVDNKIQRGDGDGVMRAAWVFTGYNIDVVSGSNAIDYSWTFWVVGIIILVAILVGIFMRKE